MLTIQNYEKLTRRDISEQWWVKGIMEGTHNDTYIILLEKSMNGIVLDSCKIMLERTGIMHRHMTTPDEMAYHFIFDSQRTNVCVTADWISDIDNMVGQLKYLLQENGKIKWI